ncbi:MAG: energy-coupling factor transporter ATPase [Clostridia bacterium]|nr:energy-coupling factor transporter ATPase [Clostridia bacterium]
MSEIKLENVSYVYSEDTPYEKRALTDVTATIKSGAITGIIGHTGSGKSTLVQMLNGLTRPMSGRVLLDGKDIWEDPKKISDVRFRVGLVMQYPEYQLFDETIRADIAFGPKNMGLDKEEIERRVLEAADFAGVDREWLDKSPFDLSGGQKRRAAIAGIIAMRPEILVLDEPAAGLDPAGRKNIMEGLCAYRDKTGSSVVIVSHSMEDMAQYCDDIIVISDGRVIAQGKKEEVFSQSDLLRSVGLDIPQITLVMRLLADNGINVNTGVYTVEDAVNEIYKLI